jgi:hypothetical protein
MSAKASRTVLKTCRAGDRPAEFDLQARMASPRRKNLRSLPTLDRPVRYEVLRTPGELMRRLVLSLSHEPGQNHEALIRTVLAVTDVDDVVEIRDEPLHAYSSWGVMFWQDNNVLTLREQNFWLEREVAA